jgi:nicotinate-nucleotide pyrophosphorylase (carboxylating)
MRVLSPPDAARVEDDVARALAEDLGAGDVTALLLADEPQVAYVLCKEDAVIAGRPWFDACMRALDPQVRLDWRIAEGDRVPAGTVVCTLAGRSRALVSGERTGLNFLQTLSGTATCTAEFVAALAGTRTRVLDTRKTIPGLRLAQKYAVRVGGGVNHRIGLFDAVMLKENHIRAAGSLAAAAAAARARFPGLPLIIEVESLEELEQALATGCTRILVDDFPLAQLHEAVRIAAGRIPLEVSGSVSLERLPEIAATGVDYVSVGALTKHVRAVDLSMKLGTPPAAN